jgi:hypothetical protein
LVVGEEKLKPNGDPRNFRRRLCFPETVKANLAFLENFGFRLEEESATAVRYQSPKVILTAYHDYGFELSIWFEKRTALRRAFGRDSEIRRHASLGGFSLSEVLVWAQSAGCLSELPSWGCQSSTRKGVDRIFSKMAALVQAYARPLLVGDSGVYEALRKQKLQRAEEDAIARRLELGRRHGSFAWERKDLQGVLEGYGGIENDLTPSEKMKLEYARKRLSADRGIKRA